MSSPQSKATTRMVVASFAAGAGAVVLLGLVAPVMMQSGLTVREAFASEVQRTQPVIEPLDREAIEARLANAEREMDRARARTNDDIARLARLAR
jgi:hypothetical protein